MEPTLNEETLASWIGKQATTEDVIDPKTCRLTAATLDHGPAPGPGDPLPPLWHWTYFHDPRPPSELGRDGHPKLGGFLPPVALPRRMWAGGRLGFERPIPIGATATKTSKIKNVVVKGGRTGSLCFVTVEHQISVEGALCLTEEHDIVYREDPAPCAPAPKPPTAPTNGDWKRDVTPSPVTLFRYSAITFNGHRIHYDRSYCEDVEGYPGLVFHGPLTATLLAAAAVKLRAPAPLKQFSFRAVSPLFDTAPFSLNARRGSDPMTLWAANASGQLAMTAEAQF